MTPNPLIKALEDDSKLLDYINKNAAWKIRADILSAIEQGKQPDRVEERRKIAAILFSAVYSG